MKASAFILILILLNQASALECAQIFPKAQNADSVESDSQGGSESSPVVRTILKRMALARGSRRVHSSSPPAPVPSTRTAFTPETQTKASISPTSSSNPHFQSFRRHTNLNIFGDSLARVAPVLAILKHHFTIVSENSSSQKPKHLLTDKKTGQTIEVSHLGLELLQAFKFNLREPSVFSDQHLIDYFNMAFESDVLQKGRNFISQKAIEDFLQLHIPEGPTSFEESMEMQRSYPQKFKRDIILRVAHYDALAYIRARSSIELLEIILGREQLYTLYFDVLYSLRARAQGESLSTPLIEPLNRSFWRTIGKREKVTEQVRQIAGSDFIQPNLLLVHHFGYSFLEANPTVVTVEALRQYLKDPEAAKRQIPDRIFDQLREQGYSEDDIVLAFKRFPYEALGLR